jgi:hypothetical protein
LQRLLGPSLERLFGLNREADGDFGRAVENLKQMVAKQATILAPWSTHGNQFNPAVTGIAFGAGNIGLLHGGSLPSRGCSSNTAAPGLTCNRALRV